MSKRPFWPRTSPTFHHIRLAVRAQLSPYAAVHSSLADNAREVASADDSRSLGLPGVVVGLSGGADSLALLAACAAETFGPKGSLAGGQVHAVIVDHQLQDGSAEVAEEAKRQALGLGVTAEIIPVEIGPSDLGPEAAAREHRHRALRRAAADRGWPLLLAHTLDDQAETMLLRLARGGGPQALSAILATQHWSDGVAVLRPLLEIRRQQTHTACAELGLAPWNDPHNDDQRYHRVRVRNTIMPLLEERLGPGVAENLAKTATIAAEDNAALDEIARQALDDALGADELGAKECAPLPVAAVVKQSKAVAGRMIRQWLRAGGAEVSSKQLRDIDALLNNYHGQGPVVLGRFSGAVLVVARKDGTLSLVRQHA